MKRRLNVCKVILQAIVILTAGHGAAGQDLERDKIGLRTRLVLIDVLVADKRTGKPVPDLVRADFEVLDEGKSRVVNHFSIGEERQPLALVLLFDLQYNGAARFLQQHNVLKSLDAALSKLSPKDEVAVLATADMFKGLIRQRELTDFTKDRSKILEALTKLPELVEPDRVGILFVSDLVSEVARIARRQRPYSRVVVVYVSDSFIILTPRDRRVGTDNLLRQNVTFNAVLTKTKKSVTARSVPFMPLFLAFGISTKGADYFAMQTGGEAMRVNKPEDYQSALETMIGDLSSRYTLGFELEPNEPDDGRLHRLEVKVKADDKSGKQRKLEVAARRGYFLPKAQETVAQNPAEKKATAVTIDQANRQMDEKAIMRSVYDLHYSVMTGDIQGVKLLTAKRTFDLYQLFFDLASKKISNRDGGQGLPASNGDELLKLLLGFFAEASKDSDRAEQIRQKARAKSECRITFASDKTANIEYSDGVKAKAVFEDGRWKIDDTDRLKGQLLGMDLFTPEQKEQIKKH